MRVLLFTGKGGVGKTSVAAATAVRAAESGLRTLIVSTDPAHSLADAFDVRIGNEPTQLAPATAGRGWLFAEQIDAQQRLSDHWREIQTYLVELLSWGGVGEVEAEELSVLPGLEEIFSLVDMKRHVESGDYDLLIVDCAPTAETLRLLSLPDALGWYLQRVFPVERALTRAVRPLLSRVTTMPLPGDGAFAAVTTLAENLEAVRTILRDRSRTSVRLVVNAERVVIAEARRTYTYLSLFDYAVDAVIVNRLLPDDVTDPWFGRWKRLQSEHLATVRAGFVGVPVLTAPLFDDELVGMDALGRLGDSVYGDERVEAILKDGEPMRFARTADGFALRLALPFAERSEVDVARTGEELHVRVGPYHRALLLPAALRRCEVGAARLADGELVVRFVAVPAGEEAAG